MENPDDDLAQWSTWALLPLAGRLAESTWTRFLATMKITPAGYRVLADLGAGSASQAALAARRRVGPQSLGRTVDRLERDGLVARDRHPDDRRQVVVRLTAAGRAVVNDVARATSDGELDLLDHLPDPDHFRADLLRVIALLQNGANHAEERTP